MNQQNDYNNQPLENPMPQRTYVTYVPYGLTPETYEERQQVKKVANTIGGAYLIVMAINFGVNAILSFVIQLLSVFDVAVSGSVILDPAFLQVLEILLSTLVFTLPFVLLFKAGGYRISSLIRFKKPKKKDILPYFLIGVSGCYFSNLTVNFMGSIFSALGVEYEVNFGDIPDGFLGFMLTVIATAVVPALVEEFACRGIVLGSLRKFGDGFAIFASAILFGVMHRNFQQIPFAFLTGLVLGFIAVKTNSIWIAVAVHFFNNFCSVVMDYIFATMSVTAQNIIYALFSTVCLVLGIIGVFILKDRKGAYKLKVKKTHSEKRLICKWFFTSPTVIIFIIICFIVSLTFFK